MCLIQPYQPLIFHSWPRKQSNKTLVSLSKYPVRYRAKFRTINVLLLLLLLFFFFSGKRIRGRSHICGAMPALNYVRRVSPEEGDFTRIPLIVEASCSPSEPRCSIEHEISVHTEGEGGDDKANFEGKRHRSFSKLGSPPRRIESADKKNPSPVVKP